MWLLLPPSETKRDGGAVGSALDLNELSFPALNPVRRQVLAATGRLARNRKVASAALGLGPTQLFEVERNRVLRRSPVLPAIERYTGVLFDAVNVPTLSPVERGFAREHVLIHSALFGLLRAEDQIPAYRLSHDSRLAELSLGRVWRGVLGRELGQLAGLVLDLRSEAYVAMGAAPQGSWFLRLVSEDDRGVRRALNHFNKKGKGVFTRAVLSAGINFETVEDVLKWAADAGFRLSASGNELTLVVDGV